MAPFASSEPRVPIQFYPRSLHYAALRHCHSYKQNCVLFSTELLVPSEYSLSVENSRGKG